VTQEFGVARSTYYGQRAPAGRPTPSAPQKRGPKTAYSDAALLAHIRRVLEASPFLGEGHRKVWARLRHAGIRTSKPRVLRVMREAQLLAPSRARRVAVPVTHDGTITTDRPDAMWGTDLTTTVTVEDGQVAVFVAVDHCTAEGVGIHAATAATRYEALEPIRQGVRAHFGGSGPQVATGLSLRHDHGSQYMSDLFQTELRFLGVTSSPAFVRMPEGNGVAERFIRTLKEQLLWVRVFQTVEELRQALHHWLRTYNDQWLIERHGHRSPHEVRRQWLAAQAA
jgi:transposase InsO family protein